MKTFTLFLCALFTFIYSSAQEYGLDWVKRVGGVGKEYSRSITMDVDGNIYSIGSFQDTVDFDPGTGTFYLASKGAQDIFILKLDHSGNFIWAKRFGGRGDDIGYSLAMDKSGNIYATGSFSDSADFDPGSGVFNLKSSGAADIFLAKMDSFGNFSWAKKMGAYFEDVGFRLIIDKSGNPCLSGYFVGTVDFDPGPAVYNESSIGGVDIFIAKYDPMGNFIWVKKVGSGGDDFGSSMALDTAGNIYTMASYQGTVDFDPGAGNFMMTATGKRDIFILKLSASGSFIWAKSFGGSYDDWGNSITLDKDGNIYSTGTFEGIADLDPGTGVFKLTAYGENDVFISKMDTAGNFVWAKRVGGPSYDYSYSIALDQFNNVFTVGGFLGSADFDPGPDVFELIAEESTPDIFIAKLDPKGDFVWAGKVGGPSWDLAFSVSVTDMDEVYVAGIFSAETDFDPNVDTFMVRSNGKEDVFVMKLGEYVPNSVKQVASVEAVLFPNPTNGSVRVQLQNNKNAVLHIEVLNTLGQKVMDEQTDRSSFDINLSSFPSGTYVLKIQDNNGKSAIQRIVKN